MHDDYNGQVNNFNHLACFGQVPKISGSQGYLTPLWYIRDRSLNTIGGWGAEDPGFLAAQKQVPLRTLVQKQVPPLGVDFRCENYNSLF